MTDKTIGERIRAAREAAGYSQVGLARTLDVANQTTSRWETGRVIPPLKELRRIAELLNKPLEYFLEGTSAAPDTTPLANDPVEYVRIAELAIQVQLHPDDPMVRKRFERAVLQRARMLDAAISRGEIDLGLDGLDD